MIENHGKNWTNYRTLWSNCIAAISVRWKFCPVHNKMDSLTSSCNESSVQNKQDTLLLAAATFNLPMSSSLKNSRVYNILGNLQYSHLWAFATPSLAFLQQILCPFLSFLLSVNRHKSPQRLLWSFGYMYYLQMHKENQNRLYCTVHSIFVDSGDDMNRFTVIYSLTRLDIQGTCSACFFFCIASTRSASACICCNNSGKQSKL
jgi:hypothetical protein